MNKATTIGQLCSRWLVASRCWLRLGAVITLCFVGVAFLSGGAVAADISASNQVTQLSDKQLGADTSSELSTKTSLPTIADGGTDALVPVALRSNLDGQQRPLAPSATTAGDPVNTSSRTSELSPAEFTLLNWENDDVIATVENRSWDTNTTAVAGGKPLIVTAAVAEETGDTVRLGERYTLDVARTDEQTSTLSLEERGDRVYLIGAATGQADVVFQLRDDGEPVYETPPISVEVTMPDGVGLLAESSVDHDHACFHGDYDARTSLTAAENSTAAPIINDTHVIWNVTYHGDSGYLKYDVATESEDDTLVFYTASGTITPTDAVVSERGTVSECETLDRYISIDIADNDYITLRLSDAPEHNGLSLDQDFLGVVADDQSLSVTAKGLTDTSGSPLTAQNVSVRLHRNGTVLVAESVDIDNGDMNPIAIDSDDIEPTVETGQASVEIFTDKAEIRTPVTLVHEAWTLDEGYNQLSIPQPAVLHTEDVRSIERWDSTEQTYVSLGAQYKSGDVIESPSALHHGLYIDAGRSGRIGYAFQTDSRLTPATVPMAAGWHLASSNFALGENNGTRTLDEDLLGVEAVTDDIVGFDYQQRTRLNAATTIGAFDTYWILVSEPEYSLRGVIAPDYNPTQRIAVLEEDNE